MVLEKTLESSLDSKKIKPVNPKGNQPWIFIGKSDPEAKTLILWPPDTKSQLIGKDSDARDARGEGGNMGWDGWMASLTQWTWVLASSGRWYRTGKPGVLQSMGSQRVRHDWATELNWAFIVRQWLKHINSLSPLKPVLCHHISLILHSKGK